MDAGMSTAFELYVCTVSCPVIAAKPLHTPQMKPKPAVYRVVKTLRPTDRGAIALAQRYGSALICVRHRTDTKGKLRHTTIELLIESTPIRHRTVKLVHVRTAQQELHLHAMIKTAGGVWDFKHRMWRLSRKVATLLNLNDRIIEI